MKALRSSAVRPHLVACGLLVFFGLAPLALCTAAIAQHSDRGAPIVPDLARIADGQAWRVINGEFQFSNDKEGRPTVRLAPIGGNRQGSNLALALVRGVAFEQGEIEVDLRGNAAGQASFLGVAFAVTEGHAHEAIYFRPFNFQAENPVQRAHAVQYVAWPQHPWDRLRAEHPGVYESAVAPGPDPVAWFHVRVEVSAARVNVFVNEATQPCLSVDRLGGSATGDVGLWVDSQPGSFANLKIRRLP